MSEKEGSDAKRTGRDFWDKVGIVLQPLGGLLTAIAVVILGHLGANELERTRTAREDQMNEDRKAREREAQNAQRYQLYSDLQSRREQADSELRKSMFDSIINTFMGTGGGARSPELELLNLELLVYNFHDALNLKPLFAHLEREFSPAEPSDVDVRSLNRLRKLGREISRRQKGILETVGDKQDFTVKFSKLAEGGAGQGEVTIDDSTTDLTVNGLKRTFTVTALGVDPKSQEIQLRLEVISGAGESESISSGEFKLGFFDFPMIDNTRLSDDYRCAVTLRDFDEEIGRAEITLLYFEGYYSSLRDKPAYNEIIEKLKPNDSSAANQ